MADRPVQIQILNGALDEWGNDLVLRGSISPHSLRELQIAEYQRGVLSPAKIKSLMEAHISGSRVPDVELSHRAATYEEGEGVFYLPGRTFVVDGQQRIAAALRVMEENSGVVPHIGALIHFGKDEAWERQRFEVVNLTQTRVSSNVTLRNLRHKLPVAKVIYHLATSDERFPLCDKVTYDHNPKKTDLLSAVLLFKTLGMLHGHMGPGRATNVVELANGLEQIMATTGKDEFIDNARRFFEIVDIAWGLNRVVYRKAAVHLKGTFLLALARLFSEHEDFWVGERLRVSENVIRKLTRFPLEDPTVATLASSGGKAGDHLFILLAEHVGTPSRPLKRRSGYPTRSPRVGNDIEEV